MPSDAFALPWKKEGGCDAAACRAARGRCAWGGFACGHVCAAITSDAGKTCGDGTECKGGCFAAVSVPAGTRTRGTCNDTVVGLGCMNRVANGVAQGTICGD